MIGLSVSGCISDIVMRRVSLEIVEKIIGSTMAGTPEEVEELIELYRDDHWNEENNGEGFDTEAAVTIFRKLFAQDKILQPRLTEGRAPVTFYGRWVDTEDQIEWRTMPPRV